MTIIFTDDDNIHDSPHGSDVANHDDINDSPHEPDVVIPSLCTPFTSGFTPAIHFIEIENARWFVPYKDVPLASTVHCDCLVDNNGCPIESHQWWIVSKGKLSEVMKATKHNFKQGLSLFDGGVNGSNAGHDMQPMDELYTSDQFATIFGITDHEISNKALLYCFSLQAW